MYGMRHRCPAETGSVPLVNALVVLKCRSFQRVPQWQHSQTMKSALFSAEDLPPCLSEHARGEAGSSRAVQASLAGMECA